MRIRMKIYRSIKERERDRERIDKTDEGDRKTDILSRKVMGLKVKRLLINHNLSTNVNINY